jgi:DNA-binding CsgD family transcriptional regulator/tetratricopeptide (TPR) repeat protein
VPLVVRELVLDGVASHRIREERGRWQGTPSVGSPESAARLLGRRLPASGPPLVALQALAIAGQLRAGVLDRMVSREVLADLEQQGFLEIPIDEHQLYVRLSHPMLADALRDGLPSAERKALLRTIVQSARRLDGEQDTDRRQYLRWSLEIGDELSTAELRDGYRTALRGLDYALAADIAGALGEREPSAEAALFHAVALARAGRFEEAVKIADAARPLALTDDEVAALARFLVRLHSPVGHSMGFHGGRDDRAMAIAAWADARLALPAFAGLLDIFTTFVGGDLDRSVVLATALFDRCAGAPPGVQEEIDQFLVMAGPLTGRFDVGRVSQRRLAEATRDALGIPAIMGAHGARVSLLMYDGRLREAYDEDDRALTQARDALAYDEMMQAAGQRGLRSFLLGDIDGAIESLDLSLQYRVVPHSRSLLIRGALAAALALRGEHDRAREVVAETDLERAQFPTQMLQLDYDHLRGLALGLAGEVDGPEKAIRTAADRAQTSGYHWLHVFARLSLVRLGWARADDAVRASKTLALVDAPLIRSVAEVVIAAVDGDRGSLATLAEQLSAMNANLFAVDALRALVSSMDDAEGASGRPATAESTQARAAVEHQLAQVVSRCPGLHLPQPGLLAAERADASTDASGSRSQQGGEIATAARTRLSPRELEIASLAAGGMTSKEIGDQLELSPRTVDNNLRRVYAKLGIGGRRDLAAALEA